MKHVIGIDISKLKFDAAALLDGKLKHKKISNNIEGFGNFKGWLKNIQAKQPHICLESTGVYGEAFADNLYRAGFLVSVVNPAQIKAFSGAQLARNKTDKADAKIIAHFCQALSPKAWVPLSKPTKNIRALVTRLETLKEMVQQEKNRLSTACKIISPLIKKIIKNLESQILKVQTLIKNKIDDKPILKHKKNLLKTIPGIGDESIHYVLAYLSEDGMFKSARAMAAYVGITPKHKQSGTSINMRTHISKVGHSELRKALYFPAIVAKKHNPVIKEMWSRMIKKGKPPMVVVCAAMRKLIHIIFGVLKTDTPFKAELRMN